MYCNMTTTISLVNLSHHTYLPKKFFFLAMSTFKLYSLVFICSVVSNSLDPLVCKPPGSSVHGIFQAKILEWVAFPPPGDLPGPGIEPRSPASPTLASNFFTTEPPKEASKCCLVTKSCLILLQPPGL